jgi:hypothetical protein
MEGCGTSFACRRVALRADGHRRVMICLPVRHHLLSGQTFCVNICLNRRPTKPPTAFSDQVVPCQSAP